MLITILNININIDLKEKRQPIEKSYKFTKNEPSILNIAAHDPQEWNSVIDIWKNTVIADVIIFFSNEANAEEVYRYCETFLGKTAKAIWEAYKVTLPQNSMKW